MRARARNVVVGSEISRANFATHARASMGARDDPVGPSRGGAPTATTVTVSQREVAALVYNYLRSNGFVKVRPSPDPAPSTPIAASRFQTRPADRTSPAVARVPSPPPRSRRP